jgi:Ca2+/Na+ antiporter
MAALGFLFVDPESLPGGNCFSPSCKDWDNSTCNYLPQGAVSSDLTVYPDCDENSAYGFVQVLFLAGVYGMILSVASDMISDGSELLLLVPSLKGLVGSLVLPILGAVPDGAIVLFSGIGKNAASSIQVGVGALAGSTIMLITLPWFIAVYAGRVAIQDGECIYSKRMIRRAESSRRTKSALNALFTTGVECGHAIHVQGKIMGATAMLFLIIQIPAFHEFSSHGGKDESTPEVAKDERIPFLVGTILCFMAFIAYLMYQLKMNHQQDAMEARAAKAANAALATGKLTLAGVFFQELEQVAKANNIETDSLLTKDNSRLRSFLRKKFIQYDKDGSKTLDTFEVQALFTDLREPASHFNALLAEMDKNSDGVIDFEEFYSGMIAYLANHTTRTTTSTANDGPKAINDEADGDEDGEDDEDEEIPEDIAKLPTVAEQQRAIKIRSLYMMTVGTTVVLLVSDPAVDVLSSLGSRMGVPGFYVSFLLAPLASNASELIAAYNYARKKTRGSINISLSTLEGAGIMNNTFCTGIFFLVIYMNETIAWTFSVETLAIILVQMVVMLVAQKKIMTLFDASLVLSMYPLSLLFIVLVKMNTQLK